MGELPKIIHGTHGDGHFPALAISLVIARELPALTAKTVPAWTMLLVAMFKANPVTLTLALATFMLISSLMATMESQAARYAEEILNPVPLPPGHLGPGNLAIRSHPSDQVETIISLLVGEHSVLGNIHIGRVPEKDQAGAI